ncbi:MAG TPA: hypothetical protein VFZ66_14315 [Herpetosiphonaceae bacterium]
MRRRRRSHALKPDDHALLPHSRHTAALIQRYPPGIPAPTNRSACRPSNSKRFLTGKL